jgi:glutamyl/glutaminyl-tRNA synthetase
MDGEERQSARLAIYEEAFARLSEAGRVYPCYETAQELDLKRKVQLGRGLPPIYDRAALALSDAERATREAEGIAPHWRFKLDHDKRSNGSTASAGRSISSRRSSATRSCAAPTARGSTCCRARSTTSRWG